MPFFANYPPLEPRMKGYWITSRGQLRVEFERPTFWRRLLGWFYGDSWVDYEH